MAQYEDMLLALLKDSIFSEGNGVEEKAGELEDMPYAAAGERMDSSFI